MPDFDKSIDEEILSVARKLRFGSNILAAYREVEFSNAQQFTLDLLRYIAKKRDEEVFLRNRQKAGFEQLKLLEKFSFDNVEMPKGFDYSWLTDFNFVESKQNLILLGNTGTGKTHLATALGVAACKKGYKPFYRRTSKLILELLQHHERGTLPEYMKRLEQKDILILDEWGYLPVHKDGMRLLFNVIADAYERRSVILTTNLPFDEWNRIFGDERLLHAMIDRLYHHGLVINHRGDSYRYKHSLMNSLT